MSKQLENLRFCRYYLETNPSEAFIKGMLAGVEVRIALAQERFGQWRAHKTGGLKELKHEYEALNELPKLRAQRRALKFLLEGAMEPATKY
jgi:hypothetical protein